MGASKQRRRKNEWKGERKQNAQLRKKWKQKLSAKSKDEEVYTVGAMFSIPMKRTQNVELL